MKIKRKVLAVWLTGTLTLGLSGCVPGNGNDVSKFDAVAYVDGLIRENYLGRFDEEYLELVDLTEEEARTAYESGIRADAEQFLRLYGVQYPSEAVRVETEDLLREIYSHASYRVISAARQDDGSYSVKVEIEPIDTIQLVEANWRQGMKRFYEKYTPEQLNAMSDSDYQAAEREWVQLLLALYQSKLEESGHQNAQSVVVQLELDDNGYYCVNLDDFSRLDALILNWSGIGGSA